MMKTISQKVLGAGVAVLLLSGLIAGVGLYSAIRLSSALEQSTRSAEILQTHQVADMMHDALRADVLGALLARDPANDIKLSEVQADIVEHSKIFRDAVAKNEALATDPAIRTALASVQAGITVYIAQAESLVGKVATDPAAATSEMPQFLARFHELEGAMAKASDVIDARAKQDDTAAESLAKLAETTMFGLLILGIAFSVVLTVVGRRSIVTPLLGLTSIMRRLAQGDNEVTIPGADRADELGQMAGAVLVFKEAALEKVSLEAETLDQRRAAESAGKAAEAAVLADERVAVVSSVGAGMAALAAGDLTFRMSDDLPPEYLKLRDDFNDAVAQLEATMTTVTATTASIGASSDEMSQASDDLSRRTEQQAAGLEQTAAALDEITSTVKMTADGARQASAVVAEAKTEAQRSGEVVGQAVQAMGQIEESSRQISQIIGVIDEIAFQTNLLALNAGVEAARAGEAGRGFAVVASEVRALAQRSAEAAKEIKTLISASTAQVGQGVSLVDETGRTLQSIVGKVAEIDTVITAIYASAQEQATGLAQVNVAVNQMDQVVQQNAAMVEEATAATHSLKGETGELVQLMTRFRVGGGSQSRPAGPRLAAATSSARPSPARDLRQKVAAGFGGGARSSEGWEEF